MAQQTPPYAIQAASHSAALFRQALSSLLYQTGPMDGASYLVSAQSTPNMTVQVSAGWLWVDGTQVANATGQNFSTQASYFGLNDAPVTLTVTTANGSNPRIDVVVAVVTDAQYSGATNNITLAVVAGTPASSPVVPTLPNNAISLAQIAVGAAVTSITNSNITATSTGNSSALGGIVQGTLVPCTSSTRPSLTFTRRGQLIHETDTTQLRIATGGAWTTFGSSTLSCTSTTHPSSPVTGMTVYETDTGFEVVWTGTAWVRINGLSDTGWTTLTPNAGNGFAAGPIGLHWRNLNGVIYLEIEVTGTWTAATVMTTIPSQARPLRDQWVDAAQYGNTRQPVRVVGTQNNAGTGTPGQVFVTVNATTSGLLFDMTWPLG